MRFDLLHGLNNEAGDRSWTELLEIARRRVSLADRLGFDGIWLGEHHFDHMGIDQCPNPVMVMADMAGRTERIRLGIAAIILPAWNPVRLAEDLSALDHMCRGRLDVALSRGILQAEIVNLNAEADRKNDAQSKEIFAENLQVLRAAWQMDPLRIKTKRFQFPHPETNWAGEHTGRYYDEDGNLKGLAIIPRPYQSGGPTLYNVTDTPGGFAAAAAQDLRVITWYPTNKVLDGLNAVYQAEREKLGLSADGRSCGILRGMLVTRTDQEAHDLIADQVRSSFAFIKRVRGIKVWLDEGEDENDPAIANADPFQLLLDRNHLMVGSPETVTRKMIDFSRAHKVDHWMLSPYRDEDEDITNSSMELMAREVLPAVRAELGDNGRSVTG